MASNIQQDKREELKRVCGALENNERPLFREMRRTILCMTAAKFWDPTKMRR